VLVCWQVFCEVAYKAKTTQDLVSGIEEYMDGLTVLPPSVWDPQTRLEPPTKSMTVVKDLFDLLYRLMAILVFRFNFTRFRLSVHQA